MSAMYLKYFDLSEAPFSITPDPAFVYLSPAHRDALAHLLYGVGQGGSGGFVQLTGEVGTGKTTLCRCLLEQLPENTLVALILNPLMTPRELLATICEELGIDTTEIAGSSKLLVDALNTFLLEQHALGCRVVVVIDEAQNLSPEALEQVRLLTNLETTKNKLLQMVFLGQPELRQLLQRQDLRQLSQRITARYHLAPLDLEETAGYVRHRMQVAGARRSPFKRSAVNALYRRSGGVPRLINIIADRALSGAYATEAASIGARLVNTAADEVQPSEQRVHANRTPWLIAAGAAAALLAATVGMFELPFLRELVPPAAVELSDQRDSGSTAAPQEAAPEPPVEVQPASDPPVGSSAPAVGAAERAERPADMDQEWLDAQHASAWRGIASLWRDAGQADAIRAACDGGRPSGFACLHDEGTWSRIRRLGLPVLLVLQAEHTRHLLLQGLGDRDVLVGVGDDARWLPRNAVESHWFGKFIVPWPQARDWPKQIKRGEAGKAVDIVVEMASHADPPWTGGGKFDEAFESWLIAFQRRHGLDADGIVGPVTLLHLMAPTIESPRLANWHELTSKDP